MKNFLQAGLTLALIAPYALLGGQGFQVGTLFAVASSDAANGAEVEGTAFRNQSRDRFDHLGRRRRRTVHPNRSLAAPYAGKDQQHAGNRPGSQGGPARFYFRVGHLLLSDVVGEKTGLLCHVPTDAGTWPIRNPCCQRTRGVQHSALRRAHLVD